MPHDGWKAALTDKLKLQRWASTVDFGPRPCENYNFGNLKRTDPHRPASDGPSQNEVFQLLLQENVGPGSTMPDCVSRQPLPNSKSQPRNSQSHQPLIGPQQGQHHPDFATSHLYREYLHPMTLKVADQSLDPVSTVDGSAQEGHQSVALQDGLETCHSSDDGVSGWCAGADVPVHGGIFPVSTSASGKRRSNHHAPRGALSSGQGPLRGP